MGLSLHYRGSLTDKRQLDNLIDELDDMAKSVKWSIQIMDGHWDRKPDARIERNSTGSHSIVGGLGLKGLIIHIHEQCDPLYFCFNASGVLTSPLQVAVSAAENYAVTPTWINVHTQAAGKEAHAVIAKLLHYLQEKYLHDLEVEDESGFWHTGNFDLYKAAESNPEGSEALVRRAAQLKRREQKDIVAKIDLLLRKMRDLEED